MSWYFNRNPTPRKYKCRVCKTELKYNLGYCQDCRENRKEDIEKYEQKLESRRKYYKGNKISSLEQFEKQKFVYWYHKIYSVEFIKSLQYRFVLEMIRKESLYEAIKKEKS